MIKFNKFLLKLGIIITILILINIIFVIKVKKSEILSEYYNHNDLDDKNLKISKISESIHINGSSGWEDASNTGLCTGEGTYSNPYNIKDLVIDGEYLRYCILIENSKVYFKIENCTVYNSGGGGWDSAGIKLINVQNSIVIKNHCFENVYGISLIYCDNNTLLENKIHHNDEDGIYLEQSDHNIISENKIYHNYRAGIKLSYSSYNTISGNNANEHDVDGIYLYYSHNNTVSRNFANHNFNRGIRLSGSRDNIIKGNILLFNYAGGFYKYNSANNVFEGNIYIGYFDLILFILTIFLSICIFIKIFVNHREKYEVL